MVAVCPQCASTYTLPSIAYPGKCPAPYEQSPSITELVNARALVQEFWNDCTDLQKLGITIQKGSIGAKVGGIAGAGAALYYGHPLLAIGLAIAGWVVEDLAGNYAQKKLEEVRLKWHNLFSSMGRRQLDRFALEMQSRYPHLVPAVRAMLTEG
jgi:hypothetical protein